MATGGDWKSSLSSLDRYENIQKIRISIEQSNPSTSSAQKDAFTWENEAFKSSESLDEYTAACSNLPQPEASVSAPTGQLPATDITPESPGITLGSYRSCHYVASGVTAEVYRSEARALKVITEVRDIEPHNPFREAQILQLLAKPCIPLLETFRDQEQRFVLVFPYMPLTLESLLAQGAISKAQTRKIFENLYQALADIHGKGIVHRDIKPSAVLLESVNGPAYLSDFGTAWHPDLSIDTEPVSQKILDIGTGPYRSPEVLFGDKAYGPAVDIWGAGVMLAECCRDPPRPLFESRSVHEDGNQLGLILSIFKTIGSPTPGTWPEAATFRTPPFEMYAIFEGKPWEDLLTGVPSDFRDLIMKSVRYESKERVTATDALQFACFASQES